MNIFEISALIAGITSSIGMYFYFIIKLKKITSQFDEFKRGNNNSLNILRSNQNVLHKDIVHIHRELKSNKKETIVVRRPAE